MIFYVWDERNSERKHAVKIDTADAEWAAIDEDGTRETFMVGVVEFEPKYIAIPRAEQVDETTCKEGAR